MGRSSDGCRDSGRGLRQRCTTSYLMPWLGSALLIGSRILADKAKDARVYDAAGIKLTQPAPPKTPNPAPLLAAYD